MVRDAPKVYAIQNIHSGKLKGKDLIKGAKNSHGLLFLDFYDLLTRDATKPIHQLKFIKKVSLETIHTYEALINLRLTDDSPSCLLIYFIFFKVIGNLFFISLRKKKKRKNYLGAKEGKKK